MSEHLTAMQAIQGIADILSMMDQRIAGKSTELCAAQKKMECFYCVCENTARGKMRWLAEYTSTHNPPITDKEEIDFFLAWDAHCISAAKEFLKLPCTMKPVVVPEKDSVH